MILIFTFETESDKDKFEYLYNKYKNLMLFKAFGVLKDARLAEDATSEAFIRIYKNLYKIEDVNANKTVSFLVTIVKNTSLTLLSKQKNNSTQEYDEMQQDNFNLEAYIMSEISSEKIYTVMNGLGEELKNIFLLKFAHGMSHREISATLHITENNVTVKLHRAKKKLIGLLEKEGYANEAGR